MASTSNKNTPGNYAAEQRQLADHLAYHHYANSSAGQAYTTHLPGRGLLPSKMYAGTLSNNNVDVESFLRGTGTTNLTDPSASGANVQPCLKTYDSLNIHGSLPVILPKDLHIDVNQRLHW